MKYITELEVMAYYSLNEESRRNLTTWHHTEKKKFLLDFIFV